MRWGSVKVWNISSAVVLNSSVAVTVVVFTEDLELVVTAKGALTGTGLLEGCHVGVEKPLDGLDPEVCCKSFPCSAIRAGLSLTRALHNCGVIFERTKSLTGCFSLDSE